MKPNLPAVNIEEALKGSETQRYGLRILDDDRVATLIENSLLPATLVGGDVFNLLTEAVTRLRRANGGKRG